VSGLRIEGEDRGRQHAVRRARGTRLAATLTGAVVVLGATTFPPFASGATAHAAAEPSAAKPSSLKYVVKDGDYLWGIAIKLGVKFVDLLDVNKFTMDTVIIPGQSVVVPEGGKLPEEAPAAADTPAAPPSAAATPATNAADAYVIVKDDTLSGIAKKLGVSITALLDANKLTLTSVILPGGKLSVPAGGKLPSVGVTSIKNSAAAKGAAAGTPASATRVNDAAPDANATNTAPATPAAPAVPAGGSTYTVVAGDFLVGIAAKNGVTLKALLTANNLIVTSSIQPGRQLVVPPPTLPIPPDPTTSATQPPADGAPGVGSAVTPTAGQSQIATVIAFLMAQIGKPYAFNTAGPDTYDCSGLVTAAYKQVGINLPHQSLLQSTKGTPVDWHTQALLPGDLVFQFSSANPTVISHVGIVVDSTHWIQAAGSQTPVKVGPLPSYSKIQAVRRIVQQ
jgi:LysM repeat protein